MKAKILASDKSIFNGDIQALLIPGFNGEIEILEGHSDAFFLLKKGIISLMDQNSEIKKIQVNGGYCRIVGGKLVILTN